MTLYAWTYNNEMTLIIHGHKTCVLVNEVSVQKNTKNSSHSGLQLLISHFTQKLSDSMFLIIKLYCTLPKGSLSHFESNFSDHPCLLVLISFQDYYTGMPNTLYQWTMYKGLQILGNKCNLNFLYSFTPRVNYGLTCNVVLTSESVDEILWCDHSNETSSAVLLHGTICLSIFCRTKFGVFTN